MGKGLRLLDDNMIKNIVDKSENLLKCFGYEVASNTVTQNTDLKNTVSIKTDFIKTDLNLETSTGTCNDKYDNKCEEITVQTISDTIIHDDNVHNEVGSTAVRTLNVLPLAAQSSIEWREIFLKLNCANKLIETDSLINQKSKIKSKSNNKNNNNDNSNNNCNYDNKDEKDDINIEIKDNNNKIKNYLSSGLFISSSEDLGSSIPGLELNGNSSVPGNSLIVNEPFTVRLPGDQFGRGITEIRWNYTNNDTEPFKTLN